ncbi:MAG: hypothetical protein HRU40_04555 [Saprospiraceae bacterium]|nr:hypothetical protein [Saprospiraceae bacterium]
MQNEWDAQVLHWATPSTANRILATFYTNKGDLLSRASHRFTLAKRHNPRLLFDRATLGGVN